MRALKTNHPPSQGCARVSSPTKWGRWARAKRGVGGGAVPYASLEDEPLTLAGLRSSVLSHEVGEVGPSEARGWRGPRETLDPTLGLATS